MPPPPWIRLCLTVTHKSSEARQKGSDTDGAHHHHRLHPPRENPPSTYLDVKEILDVEGDGGTVHWRVVVQTAIVGHVGAHGERHWLRLRPEKGHVVSKVLGCGLGRQVTWSVPVWGVWSRAQLPYRTVVWGIGSSA